jgi:hypothetical protein
VVGGEVAGQAGAVAAGALDADLGEFAESVQPGQQGGVSGVVGGEGVGAQGAAELVFRGGDVKVAVGVDPAGDVHRDQLR